MSTAQKTFTTVVSMVDDYAGDDDAQKSRLQLDRDEKQRVFQTEDKRYQLIKNVAENISLGYNVGETLMMKLKQTHDLKERVYSQAVMFFTTNEHVFTTMASVYISQQGLHEQTKTLDAMKEGANADLEGIASISSNFEKVALKAGYGSTISADSVQKLVDSIATFQEESYGLIKEYREEASQNAKEVAEIVDEGKQRVAKALENYVKQEEAA